MAQGDLNTASYLILGMLVGRDLSAYDLSAQIGRGLAEVWPRVERQWFNAPKRLLEKDLVTARTESTGRRARTLYSINPAGREALKDWLATEPRAAALEFEGLVRLLLADQGSTEDLRRTLRTVADQALAKRSIFVANAKVMLDTEAATFPEREHLLTLANRFMVDHLTHIADWAEWALAEIETWPDTVTPADSRHERSREILEAVAALEPDA